MEGMPLDEGNWALPTSAVFGLDISFNFGNQLDKKNKSEKKQVRTPCLEYWLTSYYPYIIANDVLDL